MKPPPEADWKYVSKLSSELLETLSQRINREIQDILNRAIISEYEKRGEIYDLVH